MPIPFNYSNLDRIKSYPFYVGGNFTSYNGVTANRVLRLFQDGTRDLTFNTTGANDGVLKMITDPVDTTKVYVCGLFTQFNGVSAGRIVRLNWDGSTDTSFNVGTGANNIVREIFCDGNDVYLGGDFTSFNGTTRNRIVKLNRNGTIDTTFNPSDGFNGPVLSIIKSVNTISPRLYVAGDFTSYRGTSTQRFVDVNMITAARLSAYSAGFNGVVNFMFVHSRDGDNQLDNVVALGNFTTVAGTSRGRIARFVPNGASSLIPNTFGGTTGANGEMFTAIKTGNSTGYIIMGDMTSYQGNSTSKFAIINGNNGNFVSGSAGTGFAGGFTRAEWGIALPNYYNLANGQPYYLIGGTWDSYNGSSSSPNLNSFSPDLAMTPTFFNNGGTGPNTSVKHVYPINGPFPSLRWI